MAGSAVLEREANAPEIVSGEPDVLGLYLSEVGRYPLLDRDGEVRLASAVQAGIRAEEQLSQPGEFTAEGRRQLEETVRAGLPGCDSCSLARIPACTAAARRASPSRSRSG